MLIDSTPATLKIPSVIKELMGRISTPEPLKIEGKFVKLRNNYFTWHDLCHFEVSSLQRIQMGRYKVSGIHGINSPTFHELPIKEEYHANLDEARVALHEFLKEVTVFSAVKAIAWMVWLCLMGINPLSTLIRHIISMKKDLILACYEQLDFSEN